MTPFLDIRQISICRSPKPDRLGNETWSVYWITDSKVVIQTFKSHDEALEVLVAHWTTSPRHPAMTSKLKASLPLVVPSVQAIEAWMDVADELLLAAIDRRAA